LKRKRANDVIAKNTEEIDLLRDEAQDLQETIAVAAPELDRLREEKAVVERNLGAATLESDSLETDFNERARSVQELEIKTVQLDASLQNTENELQRSMEASGN